MPNKISLPDDLQSLIEKREQEDRRENQRDQQKDAQQPVEAERRTKNRRTSD